MRLLKAFSQQLIRYSTWKDMTAFAVAVEKTDEAPIERKEDCPKIADLTANPFVGTCSGHTAFQACVLLVKQQQICSQVQPKQASQSGKGALLS